MFRIFSVILIKQLMFLLNEYWQYWNTWKHNSRQCKQIINKSINPCVQFLNSDLCNETEHFCIPYHYCWCIYIHRQHSSFLHYPSHIIWRTFYLGLAWDEGCAFRSWTKPGGLQPAGRLRFRAELIWPPAQELQQHINQLHIKPSDMT